MKIMTIMATVDGMQFQDRFMVVDGVTPDAFRTEWLKELERVAGVPDRGSLTVSVSSIGDDAGTEPKQNAESQTNGAGADDPSDQNSTLRKEGTE